MKIILISFFLIIVIIFAGWFYTELVNPYSSFTLVKPFFTTKVSSDGSIDIHQQVKLSTSQTVFDWPIHSLFTISRIFGNALVSEEPFIGDESHIIQQIHNKRFDITKPYVISGGHFAELYPRNFGLFYSTVLDGRTALSDKDWENRQRVTLQTVATDLEIMKQAGKTFPQFELHAPNVFVGQKVYTDQSDSIFAVVWTLHALTNENFISSVWPASVSAKPLQTKKSGQQLVSQYKNSLQKIINNYLYDVIDPKTGLIKTNITLSSARDGIKRQSSFYDNVIAWSTVKLAEELGLDIKLPYNYCHPGSPINPDSIGIKSEMINNDDKVCDLVGWKQKIITAFWDEKTGIFLDDLSEESKKNHIFSGDAFIVTSTQFLDFGDPEDKEKMIREIRYVQKNNLDKPFALRYAIKDQPDRLFWPVKTFTPSYMGESIWSHWGMEYIKTLLILKNENPDYLAVAEKNLESYKKNIEKYGGYPELYDVNGNIFETPFYKSVLHTGWVVNYEQAKMMLESLKNQEERINPD